MLVILFQLGAMCYGYSKCSETNFYIKNQLVSRSCIKKLLVETVAYLFNDIPFLDSHSPYIFEKWLKVAQRQRTGNT